MALPFARLRGCWRAWLGLVASNDLPKLPGRGPVLKDVPTLAPRLRWPDRPLPFDRLRIGGQLGTLRGGKSENAHTAKRSTA